MHPLNDLKLIKEGDKSGMGERLLNFHSQCETAVSIARNLEFPFYAEGIENIVISGMGGSAVGGNILTSYLNRSLKIPCVVNRNYLLPGFAAEKTLTIIISYSGNTEETLSSLNDGYKRGSKIIAIASGGAAEEFCSEKGIPLIKIRRGMQPRESLGYLFFPLLILMEKIGFVEGQEKEISETIEMLKILSKSYSPEMIETENDAKMLSIAIHGKIPLIYGVQDITDSIALRWKCQFNENSKVPAFCSVFPELNHNEIEGWDMHHEFGYKFFIIILRSEDENDRISRQIEITKSLLSDRVSGLREVWGKGKGRLSEIFSLIYLGDFASYYLAILNGVDPTPVRNIERLKKQLKKNYK
jgi:glucose/mannose-6-phosphate isomerase